MNEKQSSGKSSRMTQKLDADGFKNVKKPGGGGSGGAAPDVELAAGEQGSPETTYLISPEFKRAHSKKSVPYPPLADNKAPLRPGFVGSFSCHGQSDVGKYKENQDRGVVCFPFACKPSDERRALFIVADGHGEYGHTVSDYVVKFLTVGPAPPASKVPTLYRAKDLTVDHKPDAAEEKARIEKAGGFVTQPEWSASARVWLDKSCTWPGLAMARSIGDQCVKEVGVTADPDVVRYDFEDGDAFVVLASDGIWEFLSSDDVVQIVSIHLHGKHRGKPNLGEICSMEVIKCAIKQWKIHEDGYRDDITCTVIILPAATTLASPGA
ncbi:protein serine/threonine phosphatase [Aureococcus anophagefferens]|nr:protein serine/threonine phosphatase [Aureococcus anophagefferens]